MGVVARLTCLATECLAPGLVELADEMSVAFKQCYNPEKNEENIAGNIQQRYELIT